MLRRVVLPVAVAALAVLPSTVSAQDFSGLPGGRGATAGQLRAQFLAEILPLIHAVIGDWSEAWREDDLDALAARYTEDAVLLPPQGAPVRGRAAIRDYMETLLPVTGPMEVSMQSFDASSSISYIYANFTGGLLTSSGSPHQYTGQTVTVLRREGRQWRIQLQSFRSAAGEATPGS